MQKEASPCASGDAKGRPSGGESGGASSHNGPRRLHPALRQGEDEQAADGRAHYDHLTASVPPPGPSPT